MRYKHYILCLLLLSPLMMLGQFKEKSIKKSKRLDAVDFLERANQVQQEQPTEAIRLLETAINLAQKAQNQEEEARAYILLGKIYEQIDQPELALQRYLAAQNTFYKGMDPQLMMQVYERLGRIYLSLENVEQAETNFDACLQVFSKDESSKIKCEEGLLDVQLLLADTTGFEAQVQQIQLNYPLDSLAKARLEARRSLNFLQQNDFSRASQSYTSSVQNLPRGRKLSKEEFEPVQKVQEDLLESKDASNLDKIDVLTNAGTADIEEFPDDARISENLKIAEIYAEEDNLIEAERFVSVSKGLIGPNTDAGIAADVYKRSSEINQRRGKVNAALDDLELYIQAKEKDITQLEADLQEQVEVVKGQQQIDVKLKDTQLLQTRLRNQQILTGLLSVILVASLVFFYFLFKNIQAKRKANQKLLLRSLRTQMNPHFIFNALNSVNNFIAKNDEKAANKFLTDFSRLMRRVLDHSKKDFISFEEEIELNELYLRLEHFRFRDKFNYSFKNDMVENGHDLTVPPMLIQPFIENAVWHGLRYKEGKGQLDVQISSENGKHIVSIQDNGIGRAKSKALKTANQKTYKSTGLENIERRVALINKLYKKNYAIEVSDLDPEAEDKGTLVKIFIEG